MSSLSRNSININNSHRKAAIPPTSNPTAILAVPTNQKKQNFLNRNNIITSVSEVKHRASILLEHRKCRILVPVLTFLFTHLGRGGGGEKNPVLFGE